MYLQKTLEKKLNNTVKEYGLILDDKLIENKRRTKEEEKKLHPKKKYPIEVRMFSNDDISPTAKRAKEYLKKLNDPDILELNQKPWNSSTRTNVNFRSELKKTLFEVRHGLKDVNMVVLKPKSIELGCDKRDIAYFGWNGSTSIDPIERKHLGENDLKHSDRGIENYQPISLYPSETRTKPGKVYLNPFLQTANQNHILMSLRKEKTEEKDLVEKKVKHENPKASQEKIAALTYKEMYPKIVYDLKERQSKDISYYHDSEEMVRRLGLPNHHNEVERRINKIYENISKEKERMRKKLKIDEKRTYQKVNEFFSKKHEKYINNEASYDHIHNHNLIHKHPHDHDHIKTCADTYCYKITSSTGTEIINKQFYQMQRKGTTITKQKESKPWIYKELYHPGVYINMPNQITKKINNQESLLDDESSPTGKAWSCCFDFNSKSKGCLSKIVNKSRWVYD